MMVESSQSKPSTLGKYMVIRELGRGAVGVVYEGFDPVLQRKVALKTIRMDVLRPGAETDVEAVLQRFRREAQAVARLQHPNIVMVYDYAEEADAVFIAMELVRGKELKSYFAQKHRFDLKAAIDIMTQLLDGLAYLHRASIVHRDIKPANIILVDSNGQVKITDFGIARVDTSELTKAGEVMGTPTYMAPEQLQDKTVDGRADLFSAGVVFYELLTGEKPFVGSSMTALMHNILHAEPLTPTQRDPRLPLRCDAIIHKALAKNPADRYQSADEFKAALTGLRDQPVAAVATQPTQPASYRKGILGDLKREADLARQAKEAEAARQARLDEIYRDHLRPRLLAIHRYLFDLVEQLSSLSWSVEAEYDIPGIGKVGGLAQESYRVHIDSTETPKRVVLTFACRAPDERRYAVEPGKADALHKFFVSQQTKYTDWPSRNSSGQVKEIIYQVRAQVLVAIVCHADIAKSKIVMGVTNMEGVSSQRHEFDYTDIDDDWLDRLGNYILRKLDTIGKIYITEEERQALRERLAEELERTQQEGARLLEDATPDNDGEKTSLLRGLRRKLFAISEA